MQTVVNRSGSTFDPRRILHPGAALSNLARWSETVTLLLALTGAIGPAWGQEQPADEAADRQIDQILDFSKF